jgi:hypothetical protein
MARAVCSFALVVLLLALWWWLMWLMSMVVVVFMLALRRLLLPPAPVIDILTVPAVGVPSADAKVWPSVGPSADEDDAIACRRSSIFAASASCMFRNDLNDDGDDDDDDDDDGKFTDDCMLPPRIQSCTSRRTSSPSARLSGTA